jgi:hypothetical protein
MPRARTPKIDGRKPRKVEHVPPIGIKSQIVKSALPIICSLAFAWAQRALQLADALRGQVEALSSRHPISFTLNHAYPLKEGWI